ncbi:aldehyde dehydrogenase family protein, partial [Mycolicibacterium porcinum]|uniref:aldehyde dehydrogenase family protein n=1 Tax=Mycolicibacterium porcinum TaxID=39693 RepID=UPI0034CD1F46
MTDISSQHLVKFDLVIGGESTVAASGATYDSVDPFTGRPWARVPDGDATDIDRAVAAARAALDGPWGALTATARGKLRWRPGEPTARGAEQLAQSEVRDGGHLAREGGAPRPARAERDLHDARAAPPRTRTCV